MHKITFLLKKCVGLAQMEFKKSARPYVQYYSVKNRYHKNYDEKLLLEADPPIWGGVRWFSSLLSCSFQA
jgi:hypothetical protein